MTDTIKQPPKSAVKKTPAPARKSHLLEFLKPLASLWLTVILLGLSMILIFAGTWAQRFADVETVKKNMFHAWVTGIAPWWFFPHPDVAAQSKFMIPFVGGYTLIALLLLNLLAAHTVRFKLTWKRSGIILIHAGLILLLVGEILTAAYAHEGSMQLSTNEALNYVQNIQHSELAIEDDSPADHNDVTVIPESMLETGKQISDPRLPFDITINDYFQNSQLLGPMQDGPPADPRVDAGSEIGRRIVPAAPFNGVGDDADKVNMPLAIATISYQRKELGTWSLSQYAGGPQTVTLPNGKTYTIELRFVRTYKPYSIKLLKFTHEKYTGSDIDKNFASKVRLVDPSTGADFEALIWMNHPLRYNFQTFYQSGFDPNHADVTTLQIVENRADYLPYIALGVSLVGLLIHFGMALLRFARQRTGSRTKLAVLPNGQSRAIVWTNWLAGALAVAIAVWAFVARLPHQQPQSGQYDIAGFGQIPVSYDGRVMPLDTLARTVLKIVHGRDTLTDADGKSVAPAQWLLDLMAGVDRADDYPIFRINNPDVANAAGLKWSPEHDFYSARDLDEHKEKLFPELRRVVQRTQETGKSDDLDAPDRALFQLARSISLVQNISELKSLYLIPPSAEHTQWREVDEGVEEMKKTGQPPPDLKSFMTLLGIYADQKLTPEQRVTQFNSNLADFHATLTRTLPDQSRVDSEAYFNQLDPFTTCLVLYIVVLVLAMVSWLVWPKPIGTAALSLLVATFLFHTAALVWRIVLSGRPPVTNLYSSAIFIAWGAVLLCGILEIIFRDGVGSFVGSLIGLSSLFIAGALAVEGDTMEQLRAVLDTNIWLGTHVVCITIGYASTFVAGTLAGVYILRGVLSSGFTADQRKNLSRMIYGIVCFALLFSFVGTILGGIWADQSWGRFWGWDPKENGAILIVLWNAIILHSRWGGLVKERGVAALAVFGNVVTAWSWFGTNMLGVGLHSYGFTDMQRAYTLIVFCLACIAVMLVGAILPTAIWRSYADSRAEILPALPNR